MGVLAKQLIERAFEAMGKQLRSVAELLVVGGAAGVLTGQLPSEWTTSDVDAVEFRPPSQVEEVLRAAAIVAQSMRLPANWLNTEAGLYAHDLPAGWEKRRVFIGTYHKLSVWALGRNDLIAMKFFAHRPVDRAHLTAMKVTAKELKFVRDYLKQKRSDDPAKVDMALAYVDAWGSLP